MSDARIEFDDALFRFCGEGERVGDEAVWIARNAALAQGTSEASGGCVGI